MASPRFLLGVVTAEVTARCCDLADVTATCYDIGMAPAIIMEFHNKAICFDVGLVAWKLLRPT